MAPGIPSLTPTMAATDDPSLMPTVASSQQPNSVPTMGPSQTLAAVPSPAPSNAPSNSGPTGDDAPTSTPVLLPTSLPTLKPSPVRQHTLATASADATVTTLLAAGIGVLVGSWLMYCARKFFCKRRLRERGHRANEGEDWFADASVLPATAVATEIDAGGNPHMVDAVAVLEMTNVKGGPPVLAEATVLGSAGNGDGNDKNTLDGLMSENQYDHARQKIEADESVRGKQTASRSSSSSQGRSALRRLNASLSRSLSGDRNGNYTPMPGGAAAEEQWEEPLDDTGGLATYVESHAIEDDVPRFSSEGSHMPFPTIAPPTRAPEARRPSGAATQAHRDLAEPTTALATATGEREFPTVL